MIEEIWKNIPGYEGLYMVSNLGNVKSVNYNRSGKEKLLRPGKLKPGYLMVTFYKDGKRKNLTVHRLVWIAFNGSIPEGLEVNHKDENKTNNSLKNLELLTRKENNNFGTRNRRSGEARVNHPDRSKPVIGRNKLSGEETEYLSVHEAERQTGIYHSRISQCCLGKRKSAGGYVWRYKD